jgi:RNase adaptor protein for sRNA GlmZ degradation
MYIIIILLAMLVALHFLSKKTIENYQDYNETTCLTLAKKNEDNITSLQNDMKTLIALQNQMNALQGTSDANTKQLSEIVDQLYTKNKNKNK